MAGKGHPDNFGRLIGNSPVKGMPTQHLATLEQNALRARSPRRNRWPELAKFDERVAELQARQRDGGGERLRALRERLANAPRHDADALAAWEVADRKGPRPQPTIEGLEREITDAEAEGEGLVAAVGVVLAAKAAFVEKYRARLVRDADKATAAAHERVLALLSELAQARETLVELRQSALWASLYPDAEAGRAPQPNVLHGGLAKPVKETLGVDTLVVVERVLSALRGDADYWRDCLTPEQRMVMAGRDPNSAYDRVRDLAWHDATPEGREVERAEKDAARARYREMWGRDPS